MIIFLIILWLLIGFLSCLRLIYCAEGSITPAALIGSIMASITGLIIPIGYVVYKIISLDFWDTPLICNHKWNYPDVEDPWCSKCMRHRSKVGHKPQWIKDILEYI